jgi:hypothetical protein
VGIQRSNGMLGFDWAIHKGDPVAADSDLGIPFFPAQTVFTLRDRFDSVEALSGWNLNDLLTGTSSPTGAVGTGAGIFDAPVTDSYLLAQNVDLVRGLRGLLGLGAGALPADANGILTRVDATGATVPFIDHQTGGNLLIGGGGSDTIYGKAGDDFIDGNAWMNVRISFLKSAVTGTGPVPFATDATDATRYTVDSINQLKPYMLAGRIDPGALSIVREILTAPTAVGEQDVALFGGAGGGFVDGTGAAATQLGAAVGATLIGAGFTITRVSAGAGGLIRVTDTDVNTQPFVAPGGNPDPLLRNEGSDLLRNMEIARFTNADGSFTDITLNGVSVQVPATGAPAIADTSPGNPTIAPTQTLTLTASLGTIADANGVGALSFLGERSGGWWQHHGDLHAAGHRYRRPARPSVAGPGELHRRPGQPGSRVLGTDRAAGQLQQPGGGHCGDQRHGRR